MLWVISENDRPQVFSEAELAVRTWAVALDADLGACCGRGTDKDVLQDRRAGVINARELAQQLQ